MEVTKGHCLCGQVTFEFDGSPSGAAIAIARAAGVRPPRLLPRGSACGESPAASPASSQSFVNRLAARAARSAATAAPRSASKASAGRTKRICMPRCWSAPQMRRRSFMCTSRRSCPGSSSTTTCRNTSAVPASRSQSSSFPSPSCQGLVTAVRLRQSRFVCFVSDHGLILFRHCRAAAQRRDPAIQMPLSRVPLQTWITGSSPGDDGRGKQAKTRLTRQQWAWPRGDGIWNCLIEFVPANPGTARRPGCPWPSASCIGGPASR